jgi:hypothetical protein
VKHPILSSSPFLQYFLSCNNNKKFYERRKIEFTDSWLKDMKNKFHSIMDDPTEPQGHSKPGQAAGLNEDQSRHVYLEEVSNYIKLNKKIHKDLQKEFQELEHYLGQTADRIKKIAASLERLAANHLEIEKHEKACFTILSSTPADLKDLSSNIYSQLKSMFCRWENSVIQSSRDVKKSFELRLGSVLEREERTSEKLKVRKGMLEGIDKKDDRMIPDEQERKLSAPELAKLRMEKLYNTNKMLHLEATDILRLECQDMKNCLKEFADYTLQGLDRERMMWIGIMEKDKK